MRDADKLTKVEGIVLTVLSVDCQAEEHEKCAQVFDVPEDEVHAPVAGVHVAWGGRKRLCICFCHLSPDVASNWN